MTRLLLIAYNVMTDEIDLSSAFGRAETAVGEVDMAISSGG